MSEFSLAQPTHHDVYPFLKSSVSDCAKGRCVLIIGAGSGIGAATALAFAQAGASTLILAGRRQSKLGEVASSIKSSSPNCNIHAISTDVSDAGGVGTLFETIKQSGVVIDLVGRLAGDGTWPLPCHTFLPPAIALTATTFHSPVGTYVIINVSSIGSNFLLPNGSSYAISKTALNRLTEFTAAEGRPLGVQAVAFHPGGVADTDLTSKSPAWMKATYTDTAALSAATALYLSTPRAAYLSGRYIDARWDMEELEKKHQDRIVSDNLLKTVLLGDKRLPMPDALMEMIEGKA